MTHYNLVKLAEKMGATDRIIEVAKAPVNAVKGGLTYARSGAAKGAGAGAALGAIKGGIEGYAKGGPLHQRLVNTGRGVFGGMTAGGIVGGGLGGGLGAGLGALKGGVVDTYRKATR